MKRKNKHIVAVHQVTDKHIAVDLHCNIAQPDIPLHQLYLLSISYISCRCKDDGLLYTAEQNHSKILK